MQKNNDSSIFTNQSTEKLLSIVEFLSTQSEPCRLLDISKGTGINTSTISRYLSALINNKYVAQENHGNKYYLTFKTYQLACNMFRNNKLCRISAPYLNKLAQIFSCTTSLVTEYNLSAIYLNVIKSIDSNSTLTNIGETAPMHCTSSGKLLLSNYTNEQLMDLYSKKDLEKFTKNTITTLDSLIYEVTVSKQNNCAFDDEEYQNDLRCLSVPIYNEHKIIATITISGHKSKMTDNFVDNIKPTMLEYSKQISKIL